MSGDGGVPHCAAPPHQVLREARMLSHRQVRDRLFFLIAAQAVCFYVGLVWGLFL